MINVKKNSLRKNLANTEIANLVKILGLPHPGGSSVGNVRGRLRYHKVVIVCDQDPDGSHIKGLIINFFHTYYPELLRSEGFLNVFHTPIVVGKYRQEKRMFFTLQEFNTFRRSAPAGWSSSGTRDSVPPTRRKQKTTSATWTATLSLSLTRSRRPRSTGAATLLFRTRRNSRNSRKKMVCLSLDESGDLATTFEDFFTKELPVFWRDDNERSMTNVVDGLKVAAKDLVLGAGERLVGRREGSTGRATVGLHVGVLAVPPRRGLPNAAIVKMAQDFMGSNNVNFLVPNGQFGTRLQNGKDAASERYIHTYLHPICKSLFPASLYPVLDFQVEDGKQIEPVCFVPVIPFSLINGARGIGTGMKAFVPSYHPKDVVRAVEAVWANENVPAIVPWYRGFRGKDGARGRRLQV